MKNTGEIEISGTVESVVFHTEETGYTVCSVRLADGICRFLGSGMIKEIAK